MKKKHLFLTVLMLAFGFSAMQAKQIYVKSDGTGDGTSWENAAALRTALTSLVAANDEIFVAAGDYETTDTYVFGAAVAVKVYGGLAGTEEGDDLYQIPDLETNKTYLKRTSNSGKVLNIGVGSEWQGFYITGGNVTGNSNGGGIDIAAGGKLSYSKVYGNTTQGSGGGVNNRGTLDNCQIFSNFITAASETTTRNGGGIYNEGTVINCIVSNNTAGSAGGIQLQSGNVINCIVRQNEATIGAGGGISGSNGNIINCTIVGNTASGTTTGNDNGAGGGVGCGGTGVNIKNCIVYGNIAVKEAERDIRKGSISYSFFEKAANHTSVAGNIVASGIEPLFADASSDNYNLLIGSPCINAGLSSAIAGYTTDLALNKRISGKSVDIGAYEYQFSDFVIEATDAASSANYDPQIYGDIIFKSTNSATGRLTGISTGGLEVNGVVKLQKTFTEKKWYPIGFPFALASVVDNTPGTYFGEELMAFNDETKVGDYWLKSYSYEEATSDGSHFAYKYDGLDGSEGDYVEHEGYIIQFPQFYGIEDPGEITVLFTSKPGPTLSNTNVNNKLSSTNYTLVANPSVGILTGIDAATHHYPYVTDKFLLTTSAFEVKPFEALIAANLSSGVSPITVIGDLDGEGLSTGLDSRITVTSSDPVIETKYYTTQGVEVQKPSDTGVYIVKEIHASQKATVTKTIHKSINK
ncbi:MAG: hypothetical protein LBO74_13145 [Candidatus Symbiothrix sp.]|nr:hypothetical protein [Candidatus Symbiothrix sp.]